MSVQMYYFSSQTCNPCKSVKPIITELQEEHPSIQWFNVDIHNDPTNMAQAYGVTHVPTLAAVCNGTLIGKHSGTQLMGYFALTKRLISAGSLK